MFKVGDKVMCVDGDGSALMTGDEFVINRVGTDFVSLDDMYGEWYIERFQLVQEKEEFTKRENETSLNKYQREIKPGVFVDVYDVIRAFTVVDPCLQHAIKKLLAAGERGHKDRMEDLKDIVNSVDRAIEMHVEWNNK